MNIRKRLGLGIVSGALGLSLIGGGTWAAFNDVEEVDSSFKAGTLDLAVGTSAAFNFRNLSPGTTITEQLTLKNKGSLDIDDVFVHANKLGGWEDKDILNLGSDYGTNDEEEFLSQFSVKIKKQGTDNYVYDGTLQGLLERPGTFELTGTGANAVGLASGNGEVTYDITIKFEENNERIEGSRLFKQNKFQGEESNLELVFEATQMPGEER